MSITAAGAAATVTGVEAELAGVERVAACASTERESEVSFICADVISVSIGSVAANVAHALAMPDSDLPLVGASGAVAAVMAAFVVFHALVRIRFFWWLILFGFFELPAIVPIGAWLAFQLYDAFASPDAVVAYWAHIGGFAFGLLVAVPVRLWGGPVQRAPSTPRPRAEAGPDDLGGLGLVLAPPSGTRTLSEHLKRAGVRGFDLPRHQVAWIDVQSVVKALERAAGERSAIVGAGVSLLAQRRRFDFNSATSSGSPFRSC